MNELLKSPATAVWALLVALTATSWAVGTDHGLPNHEAASVIVLGVAFFKVRLIGLHFMEVRHAPVLLRSVFEAWTVVVCAVTISLYLRGG